MLDLTRPVTAVIAARTSRRTYQSRALDPDHRDALQACVVRHPAGPFGSALRFELVAAAPGDMAALKGLGTYGFIRNPAGFLVGAVARGPHDLEDYGYALETILLRSTDLGLGTCWLGGSFTASTFAERIKVTADETVPAVAAIGYAAHRAGAVEQVIRWSVKARKRLPWEALFFDGSFSRVLTRAAAGRFGTALEMVRIGPSASNKQPWRIARANDALFHLYLQRSPGYRRQGMLFKTADLQRVDMGIAMCHFEATCREAGIEGAWTVAPAPALDPLPVRTEYVASFHVD